jgi:hypothetical protein
MFRRRPLRVFPSEDRGYARTERGLPSQPHSSTGAGRLRIRKPRINEKSDESCRTLTSLLRDIIRKCRSALSNG